MGKPLRVLIVEDSEDDALLLLRELQRGGYEVEFERVETASALQAALTQKTWDLILSDYSLPNFNAPQALEVMKSSGQDLPFIIMSGTIGEETAVAALKAGANDFLVKGKFARMGPAIERELREAESRRERRRAEDQLKYQARLLRHINDAVIATDDQLRITAWNRAAERIYGWSSEEVLGRNVSEILSDELTDKQRAATRELLQQSSISHSERIYRRKNGRTIYVEANTIALTDAQGKLTGYVSVDRDVTERKQAEQEIESLAKFPYEDISPVLRFARDGRLLYANPASADLLKLWNCKIGDRPPEEIQLIVYQSLVIAPGHEIEVAHGGTIDALRFVPIVGKDYVNVYGRDITERKQSEEALRQSERKFKRLFEIVPVGISLLDRERNVINMNPVLEEILHLTQSEMTDRKFRERKYIQPDGAALPFEELPSARALRENHSILGEEFGIVIEDGQIVWTQVSATPLDLPDAKVVVVTQDITERRQAEEKIERQLRRLNALRAIDVAISSSFDIRVTLDIVLQQVLSQLGVDAAAILLFSPPKQTMEYAASRGFRSNTFEHAQLKLSEHYKSRLILERLTIHIPDLLAADGELLKTMQLANEDFVDYHGTPLIVKGEVKGILEAFHRSPLHSDPEWLGFLETLAGEAAIAIDNAQLFENLQRSNTELERRVAERTAELNRINLELAGANRAKDEFLATMSHELRTPLNSILGLSESLLEQRREPLSEHQQKSLQTVADSGHHLLELINDILDLSKIEAGKFEYHPQSVAVDDLCQSSLAFIKEQATRKSITVTYQKETAVSKIYADPRRFKQILVNLLTNAVKFTLDHGQVTLQVQADAEQDRIQFSVIDNGIGIARNDMKLLFVPFAQVDSSLTRAYEGTGLGLTLVQKLIDLHGGSVDVESEVGQGSRFTINLPLGQPLGAQEGIPATDDDLSIGKLAGKSKMPVQAKPDQGIILLAEDNLANILTIGDYLESHGYKIVTAHNGLEAIEKALAVAPNIILMDIQMPVMDGLEAIGRIRALPVFASTPIIAFTALAMPGDRERCLEAGANEYMSKPVSLKKLLEAIGEQLHQSQSSSR